MKRFIVALYNGKLTVFEDNQSYRVRLRQIVATDLTEQQAKECLIAHEKGLPLPIPYLKKASSNG